MRPVPVFPDYLVKLVIPALHIKTGCNLPVCITTPDDNLTCQCTIGKLLKFYTKNVNFGVGNLWNCTFWNKRARIYMTKGTKCTFGGEKNLCASGQFNAGRRTDFRDKKSTDFCGENFLERFFWREITAREHHM